MASARGDALDWALALARAPGERHALRQRPLPDGMETVLQVAGGSHAAAIDEAAAHAGMATAEVVEAARFYLREMLFFPDADPYRVLGLAADASDEQVKHHHRLLQQWLHPDRPTSDWDAAFAARVNAAWSQLRTPARREAHAARVGVAVPVAASEPSWSRPARVAAVAMAEEGIEASIDEDRWRRRAPVLALFGVCAVLGVLAVRDMQREPERGLPETHVAEAVATEASPAVALRLPAPAEASPAAAKRAPAEKPRTPKRIAAAPSPRASPLVTANKPAPKPVLRPDTRPPATVAVASKPVAKPSPKPLPKPLRPATPPVAAVAVVAKPRVAPPKPVSTAVTAVPARKPPVAVVAAAPRRLVVKPATTASVPVPGKPTPRTVAVAVPVPAKPPLKTMAVAVPVKPAAKMVTHTPTKTPTPSTQIPTQTVAKTPGAAAPVVAAAKPVTAPPSRPAPVALPQPEPKPAMAVAPAVAAAPPTTPAPGAVPALNSPAQVAQAQQTGQRLLAFVAGRGSGMPPIWANLSAQNQASGAREALKGSGRVAIGTPNWRVRGGTADMQASLTQGDGKARRLRVDLVWREQRWLVTGLALEQAP